MALSTFNGLKTAITSFLGDDAQNANRVDFITLAEAYFNRTLRHTAMEEQTTLTTDSSGLATLPDDYLAIRSVRYSGQPLRELKALSLGTANRLSPYDATGTVFGYVITSISNVQTLRLVDPLSSADLIVTYFEKIPALSDTQTTNWLLDLAPDAYFYRALAEAYTWRQSAEKALAFMARADQALDQITSLDERGRYMNAEIVFDGIAP